MSDTPLIWVAGGRAADLVAGPWLSGQVAQVRVVSLEGLAASGPEPALVVLDPDGAETATLEAAAALRARGAPLLPVILFVAGQAEVELRRRCLAAGGTDFIDWPADPVTLGARVAAYLQLAGGQGQQQADRQDLNRYRSLLEREQVVARSVFATVLRSHELEKIPNLRWQLTPDSIFNGDLILATRSPGGNLHLLLGDFPGRGLGASIGSLPAAEIFYTMSAKGFEPIDIVLEINKRLRTLLPVDIFFAACFIEVDAECLTASIWNGGLPDLLLYRAASGRVESLASRHTPLSILPNDKLSKEMDRVTLEQDDRLYAYTNTLVQALAGEDDRDAAGFLRRCIENRPERGFDCVLSRLSSMGAAGRMGSDTTLLEYRVDQHREESKVETPLGLIQGTGISTQWEYEIRLGPDALRNLDPRPMLTQLLVEVQGLQEHRERLFTIVAELFSNALEHGVLRLNSQLKSTAEGFAHYYLERELRLEALQSGLVSFHLGHQPTEQGGVLTIEVEDSGQGFDYERKGLGQLDTEGYCGRGIGLIRQMSGEVVFYPPGNRVKIGYHWLRGTG